MAAQIAGKQNLEPWSPPLNIENDFVALVVEMRAAQRAEARRPCRELSERRRELERMVDASADELISGFQFSPVALQKEGR